MSCRRPCRTECLRAAFVLVAVLLPQLAVGQANGRLQIHFMDVWQGDAALLISPEGETVLFDNGVKYYCDMPVAHLDQLGVSTIDYHIASHYHSDHIGCAAEVLGEFSLEVAAYDRGGSYHTDAYDFYIDEVGALRRTALIGQEIVLDAASATPVTIRFVALNATTADGVVADTHNENDLSVVAVIE